MEFEWNARKAELNVKKHGVTFDEAIAAFDDENAVEFLDEGNSIGEVRFRLIGASPSRLLFVSFTERADVTRIISARAAETIEIEIYHEFNKK